MKKNLLLFYLLFSTACLFAQTPQLDATVSFELNSGSGNYRLKIVINQDISFKFSEPYSSAQNAFAMIIKDLYTSNPAGGLSGGENTLTYVSTNTANASGQTSNGLGTYAASYGPFVFPNDEQIGFTMAPGSSFSTNDYVRIKAGTIIQNPGNFSSVPTINPGPYTVVIANSAFNGIAATAVNESVLSIDDDSMLNSEISFYPNPVKDILNITSKRTLKGVQIFNMSGLEVLKTNHLSEINVSGLASAVYILKINTDEQAIYKKIVIN